MTDDKGREIAISALMAEKEKLQSRILVAQASLKEVIQKLAYLMEEFPTAIT